MDQDDAVDQYRRLNEIPSARRSNVATICEWLNSMHRGAAFLTGSVEDVWNVQLGTGGQGLANSEDFYGFEDGSGIVYRLGTAFAWMHRLAFSGGSQQQVHHIDTSTAGALARTISTIIASVLPVIPIVVFYFVEKLLVRIGLVIAFTAFFAALLVIGLQLNPDTTLGITTAKVSPRRVSE